LAIVACNAGGGSKVALNRVACSEVDNLYVMKPMTSNVPMVNTFVTFGKRGRCLIARSSNINFTPVFVTTVPVSVERGALRIGGSLLVFGRRYEFVGATGSDEEDREIARGGCPGRTLSIPGGPQASS
jgi:hypothetical protein